MSQLSESPKEIVFGGRFILKKFSGKIQHYNVYHGLDLESKEQVTAYVKLVWQTVNIVSIGRQPQRVLQGQARPLRTRTLDA